MGILGAVAFASPVFANVHHVVRFGSFVLHPYLYIARHIISIFVFHLALCCAEPAALISLFHRGLGFFFLSASPQAARPFCTRTLIHPFAARSCEMRCGGK